MNFEVCKLPRASKGFLNDEYRLFWNRLLKNPRNIGAIFPSSDYLGRFVARIVSQNSPQTVIEIGAGTGRLTQSLLRGGIHPTQLLVVELDFLLIQFLQKNFPFLQTIHGDAFELPTLLPLQLIKKADVIISGIPLMNLTFSEKIRLMDSCFQVLKPQGRMIQFSYNLKSPLPFRKMGLFGKRLGHVFFNIPPATIWEYRSQNPC
jgi:phosphatidylethanolamine/phosphatidyl-N-methylethanolamine N-methyltransferase